MSHATYLTANPTVGLAFQAFDGSSAWRRRLCGAVFIASGVFGILGISRYRVSLDFAMTMIGISSLLFSVALLLTLWKLYQSLKALNYLYSIQHEAVHA